MGHVAKSFVQICSVATAIHDGYERRCGGAVHIAGLYVGTVRLIRKVIYKIVALFYVFEKVFKESNWAASACDKNPNEGTCEALIFQYLYKEKSVPDFSDSAFKLSFLSFHVTRKNA